VEERRLLRKMMKVKHSQIMVKGVYPKLAKSCLFLQDFVAIVRKMQQTTEKNTVRDSGSGMPDPYENCKTVKP